MPYIVSWVTWGGNKHNIETVDRGTAYEVFDLNRCADQSVTLHHTDKPWIVRDLADELLLESYSSQHEATGETEIN